MLLIRVKVQFSNFLVFDIEITSSHFINCFSFLKLHVQGCFKNAVIFLDSLFV